MEGMPKINWESIWKFTLIGAVTLIFEVAVIVISQQSNVWFIVFSSIGMFFLALGIVQFSWIGIEKANLLLYRWRTSPRIKHWFILQNQNDLRLRIHNLSQSKEVYIELRQKDFLTLRGKRYIHEYPNELSIVRNSRVGSFPLFTGTLTPNDTIEIKVGFPHNGKISLRILGDDSPVYKFRDGRFEYIVSCNGKYLGKPYTLPEFSSWLTIKDGVLAKIDDEL